MMSEYGKEKTLNEIIKDLAHYCTLKNRFSSIKIILPKEIIQEFTNSFLPKEKFEDFLISDTYMLNMQHPDREETCLFANEGYDVVKKELYE